MTVEVVVRSKLQFLADKGLVKYDGEKVALTEKTVELFGKHLLQQKGKVKGAFMRAMVLTVTEGVGDAMTVEEIRSTVMLLKILFVSKLPEHLRVIVK